MTEFYYRYEARREGASLDDSGDLIPGSSYLVIRLRRYEVLKHTPQGATLYVEGRKRFVSSKTVKQFAHATCEEARLAFIARKARQIRILKGQLFDAEMVKDLAEEGRMMAHYRQPLEQGP